MGFFTWAFFFVIINILQIDCQPQHAAGGAGDGAGIGGGPPPGRGFQLRCSDDYALADQVDPDLKEEFSNNAPPGYEVQSVEPCIYPGKNAHRFLVKYRSLVHRQCEDIGIVRNDMNNYKPQNSNIGAIAVVPGGYLVEYTRYCSCYRRAYRRRRWIQPRFQLSNKIITSQDSCPQRGLCNDPDRSCKN